MKRDKVTLSTPAVMGPITVKIHGARFRCTCCGNWKPASDFGLLYDHEPHVVRNQPQCKKCRSRYDGIQDTARNH